MCCTHKAKCQKWEVSRIRYKCQDKMHFLLRSQWFVSLMQVATLGLQTEWLLSSSNSSMPSLLCTIRDEFAKTHSPTLACTYCIVQILFHVSSAALVYYWASPVLSFAYDQRRSSLHIQYSHMKSLNRCDQSVFTFQAQSRTLVVVVYEQADEK